MTHLMRRLPLPLLLASLALPAQAQTQPQPRAFPDVIYGENPATTATPEPVPAPAQPPVPEPAPEPAPEPTVTPVHTPTLSDLGRSLRNYFTEEELTLLFQYMKESVIPSFRGEEVTLPPDLAFKLEILLVRLKKESNHYMDNLTEQLENDLKKNIEEKFTPPPIKNTPYNPWLNTPWQ